MSIRAARRSSLSAPIRKARLWNKSGVEVAAYIPFYPDCLTAFLFDTEVADRPIRIFGGALDDYNPVSACKAYVERLRSAGHDAELTVYPAASHAFDNPLGAQPAAVLPKFESARHCTIREEAGGVLVNVATRQPFSYKDACVDHGPHLGYDPVAADAARSAVQDFLRSLFKLE